MAYTNPILKPDNCGIYIIQSSSGGQYVGSSISIKQRITRHKNALQHNKHYNDILQRAWNKYNGNLEFKQILICRPEDLLYYEQLIIDNYKPRYNLAPIAGNCLGRKHSLDSIAKMKNRIFTEEHRNKLSISSLNNKSRTGLKHTEETKIKMSDARKGIKYSDETLQKMSDSAKLRKTSLETKVKLSIISSKRRHSEETKLKMRNSALKRWADSRG